MLLLAYTYLKVNNPDLKKRTETWAWGVDNKCKQKLERNNSYSPHVLTVSCLPKILFFGYNYLKSQTSPLMLF